MSDALHHPYNLSFTAASLRPELARIMAEHWLVLGDWTAVRERVLATSALQTRSVTSAVRLERELRQRLTLLTPPQLALLAGSTADDRAAMAWLAAMKQHAFLFEFAAEVLRDKLVGHDPVLRPSDYEVFVEVRRAAHPELVALTETTRVKVRNVLLRCLFEAGLLGRVRRGSGALGMVQRPILSAAALAAVRDDDSRWLAGFLMPDAG